ncbi:MAG: dihydrodipicolinate synthase family protein, partial [Spirochaetales bacterium]
MNTWQEKLKGVFVPMVTPFRKDEILYSGIRSNVERWNTADLTGYFVLGTNGEYKSLTIKERFRVLDTVVRASASNKVIMAGCGAESTRETIELIREASYRGATMASILMPSFFAKSITEDVMVDFITEVADNSPIPVVLYNNPAVAAGVAISYPVLCRVSQHPNVVGIKDSSKDTYKENLKAASSSFSVLAGSANYFLDLLQQRGTGGVLSL